MKPNNNDYQNYHNYQTDNRLKNPFYMPVPKKINYQITNGKIEKEIL